MPLTELEIVQFYTRLRDFVLAERDANAAEIHSMWHRPLPERVAKGWAIPAIDVVDIERQLGSSEFLVTLQCERDESRFREGDYVKLSFDQPAVPDESKISGRIISSEDGRLVLAAERCRAEPGTKNLVLDADLIDLTDRYEKALATLVTTNRGRDRVIPLLLNRIEPCESSNGLSVDKLRSEGFNETQIDALERASRTDLCHLVQGPPGTGKTRVLARLVRQLLEQKPDAAILVTSFTHRAIDNALTAVLNSGVDHSVVFKISAHAPREAIPHAYNVSELPFAKHGGPIVIGATPFVLENRVTKVEFDWVIVDEASQMTLPLAAMAMVVGERWIFFGDHKQMPPVVHSIPARQAIMASVFGVLQQGGYTTTLNTTYRLNDVIARWPSSKFYNDALKPSVSAKPRRLLLPSIPKGFEVILGSDPASVFVECSHFGSTTFSAEECLAAASIVHALYQHGFPLNEVGIVVPYRLQARGIKTELARRQIPSDKRALLVADTVERMQGQEREIIIVSLTTSHISFAAQVASFLMRPERLNVSITRAKTKLIVLGSRAWLKEIPNEVSEASLFSDFLRSCVPTAMPSLQHG